MGAKNASDNVGYEMDRRFWDSVLYVVLFFARFGAVLFNVMLLFTVWTAAKAAYDEGVKKRDQTIIDRNRNNNPRNPFHRISTEERIRKWQEYYGDVESIKSVDSFNNPTVNGNENDTHRRSLSDNLIRSDLPWSYADNIQDISKQRYKLTSSNTSFKDRRPLNIAYSNENITRF